MADGTHPQLYDLAKDESESRNLAENHPAIVQRLSAKLLAWYQSVPAAKAK